MAARKHHGRSRNKKTAKHSAPGQAATLRRRFVVALCCLVAIGALSPWVWLGIVSEQLGVYLLLPLWLLGIWSLRDRAFVSAGAIVAVSALALWPAVPLMRSVTSAPSPGPTLTLLTLGLDGTRPADDDFARWLRSANADVIVLTGTSPRPEDRFRARAGYRSWSVRPARGHSLTILSRLPVAKAPVRRADQSVRSVLRVERCPLWLTALRLPSAWNAARSSERKRLLEKLDADRAHDARVWVGDFGGDVRGADTRALMKRARLDDSRRGFGRNATWPVALGPLGIAMDHVLVGGWVAVRERGTGPALRGAPRLPARATLQLTSPRCARGR